MTIVVPGTVIVILRHVWALNSITKTFGLLTRQPLDTHFKQHFRAVSGMHRALDMTGVLLTDWATLSLR